MHRTLRITGLLLIMLASSPSCSKLIFEDRRECVMDFHLELAAPYPQDVKDDFHLTSWVDGKEYDYWTFSLNDFLSGDVKVELIKQYTSWLSIICGWPEEIDWHLGGNLNIPKGKQAPYAFSFYCEPMTTFYDESYISIRMNSLSVPITVYYNAQSTKDAFITFTSEYDGFTYPKMQPHEGEFRCRAPFESGKTIYVPRIDYVSPELKMTLEYDTDTYHCDIGWDLRESGYDMAGNIQKPVSLIVNLVGGKPSSITVSSESHSTTIPLSKEN